MGKHAIATVAMIGFAVGAASAAQEPPPASSEKTDPSGAIVTQSPDPFLTGMDAGKTEDPEYRVAYGDCMRKRLGGGR